MKNAIMDIPAQEELVLVSQGIDKLIAESVEHRKKDILEILKQYPSLKKERFSDPDFKQTVFDAYKKHFDKSVDYHLRYNYHIIEEYCKQFPFLIKMTLKDQDAQDKLQALAVHEVEWLMRSAEHHDDECTEHASDRMGSLFAYEDIYNSPFVSDKIKQSNLPGLKKALYRRYQSRHDGPRLKRVHDLAQKAGISDYEIGQVMYNVRSHGNGSGFARQTACDPKLLEYKEFPKEKLKTEEAKKTIRGYLESHISEGRMETIKSFVVAYPFLKEKLKAIAEKIKAGKEEEEKYDEETERLIYFITKGKKKRLGRLDSEKAEEINTYFADIVAVIPRAKIVEGISTGMNAINGHSNDKVKDKYELLKRFPLTKEEINEFIKSNRMNCLDGLMDGLKYFPDHDFSDIFAEPEVKAKLFAWLMDQTFPGRYSFGDEKKIAFLKGILNATQEELEDRYIVHFIGKLKKDIEERNRSRNIKHKLKHLRNLCTDKEKYKKNIDTEEIKTLLLTGAKMRICDSGFSDSFGYDHQIQEICSHESFPLKPEDINQKVLEVFLARCRGGSVPYRRDNYACIKKYVDEKNPELVEAGIQGLLKLLDASRYDSDYNIDSKLRNVDFFVYQLPFLKDELKNEKIKDALINLKKHFLKQGRANKMDKLNKLIADYSIV